MMAMFADVIAPLERLFQVLVTASIGGAVVITVIAILCRVTSRLTPRLRCTIWWLAALKLVIALIWVEPVVLRVLPFSDAAVNLPQHRSGKEVGPSAFTRESAIDAGTADVDRLANAASWRAFAAAAWIVGATLGLGVMIFRSPERHGSPPPRVRSSHRSASRSGSYPREWACGALSTSANRAMSAHR